MKKITLSEMLKYDTEENIKKKFLNSFKSLKNNDVEEFLHNKAIEIEKKSISTTHLIFDNKKLVGYLSLSNKNLILPKERIEKLSNSKRKRLLQSGQILENGHLVVNSYLIGHLGENYNF